MVKLPRRGLMAMEAIGGVEDVGHRINDLGQIAPQMPTENAIYVQPLHPEHFDLAVKPGKRITGQQNDDEGVDFFMEPLVPGEVPDLNENVHLIAAIESQLQDLVYVGESMIASNGMCQQFALEAQKVIPDFGGVPINYYTQTPTATRYKVAMEELSKGIWAAIAAGSAVVLAIIGKLIFWLLGRRKKGGDGGGSSSGGSAAAVASSPEATPEQVKEAVAEAKQMPAEVKAMGKSMDAGQKAIHKAEGLLAHANLELTNEHGKKYSVRSLQDIIDNVFTNKERYERSLKFLNTRDGYVHDIINNGAYTKRMAEVASRMSVIGNALSLKADMIDRVIKRDIGSHSVSDQMKNTDGLKSVGRPIEVTIQGRTMNLSELASSLRDEAVELREKNVSNPIMFDKLFTTMAQAYESHTIDVIMHESAVVIDILGNMNVRLTNMKGIGRTAATDGIPGALTEGVGDNVRETVSSLQSEVLALSRIAVEITSYFEMLEKLANYSLGFGLEVVVKASKAMKTNKQPVPDEWKDVIADLTAQKEAITESYKRMSNRR